MPLTTEDKILIETRLANDGPSMAVAYVLWVCLGIVSAHRFYLGRWKTAVLQILTMPIGVGFVWLFVDLFLIPGMVRRKQAVRREILTNQALGFLPAAA